jgi:N-acetylglutamate synthase-like GNAT family acetyltransferase
MDTTIRRCRLDEAGEILGVINAAAERYRGAIPDDCFHDPYMSAEELAGEIADGVEFWGAEAGGRLVGVMGLQDRGEVMLIRHAYVRPGMQGVGIGGALMSHLRRSTGKPMLIGTWAAAEWAIRFYQARGFRLVPSRETPGLLSRYWTVGPRQIEVSMVLTDQA